MTTTATTKTAKSRPLPWGRYRDEVDAQIEAGLAREQARGPRTRTVNGQPVYRDPASRESYTVGYGGERTYSQPAQTTYRTDASPAQKKLIDDLMRDRECPVLTEDVVEGIKNDRAQTRRFIDFLLAQPRRAYVAPVEPVPAPAAPARARLNFDEISDGNYALPGEGDEIKFYRVSRNGQWVNVQVRASDSLFPVKGRAGIAVLHKIVEFGLAESRMLFATRLERCWMCGKSLTDETSRARGMGPDCANK